MNEELAKLKEELKEELKKIDEDLGEIFEKLYRTRDKMRELHGIRDI
jgi:citrate synthase